MPIGCVVRVRSSINFRVDKKKQCELDWNLGYLRGSLTHGMKKGRQAM